MNLEPGQKELNPRSLEAGSDWELMAFIASDEPAAVG